MVVTESGIVMLTNELHPQKALPPMVVTESGIAMLVNERQYWKAPTPMVVTESGMVTVFTASLSAPHASHESSPSLSQRGRDTIVVVPSGMLKWPNRLVTESGIWPMHFILRRHCLQ